MRFWPRREPPPAKRNPVPPEMIPTEVTYPPPAASAPVTSVNRRSLATVREVKYTAPRHTDPGADGPFKPNPAAGDANPGLSKPIALTLPPREAIIHYPDTGWSAWRGLAQDSPVALPPAADVMIVRRVGAELPALPSAGAPSRPYTRANLPGSAEPADSAELP